MEGLEESLEEFLQGAVLAEVPGEVPEAPKRRFVVENAEQANWAVRKVKKIRERQAEAKALADREIAKVSAWLEQRMQSLQREEEFFASLLEEWHRKLLQEDPRMKTVKLPEGALEIRRLPPEFRYEEEVLLGWVRENHPDCVVVKERVAWAALKKRLKVAGGCAVDPETGEVVPGVEVVPDRDIFRVKPRQE